MLSKYRISRRQFLNPDNKVEITDVERETLLGADGEEYDLLRCYMDDVGDFKRGDTLLGVCEIPIMHTTYADRTEVFNFTDKMVVTGVSNEEKTISFYVDKYAGLEINTIALQRIEDYDTGAYTDWVYVYFFNSHYFSNPDLVTADDEESEDYSLLRAPIHLYIDYYDNNGALQTAKFIGDSIEYINITTLRISADNFPDDLMTIVFGDTSSLSPTNGITGDTANLTFYRKAFKYSDTDFFSLFWDRPLQLMQIPLVQTFDTNMYQEDAMENFIADEEKKAIGTIADYEKDVYVPVTSGFSPVYKMIFNFHFREHRGDNWTVSSEGNWNGTKTNFSGTYDVLSLMGKSKDENYAYFSYNETDTPYDESFQSDLMSYLDFTNDDIRYQKNKVKKSFLRLSFYDSTNPASQNLLAYSTIFIDSGTLFTKYSKHFEDSPYSAISYDTDGDYLSTAQKLSGIRVNREPYGAMLPNSVTEDIEDVRLSSQLVVQDKYNSTSSSEGFYLYLWKSEDNGAEPRDIYMKAEFNHAGYGRTIPMMLPYWDYDDENGDRGERRVKTFKEICEDWNIDNGQVSGYGVKTYMRYSYIHLKCQYDKDSGQYVYYPNVDVYKDMKDTIQHDENTLIFNLYEARMGEISDDTAVRSYEYDCDSLQSSLSLTYNTIPVAGGIACPTLTWTIYATDKETGKTRTFTQNNTPDAAISYAIESTVAENFDSETGCFSVGETEETAKIEVATVTATVTFKECVDSATATTVVYQNAAEVEYCSGSNLQFYGDSMENVVLPCTGCGGCWNCDSADDKCKCEDCVDRNCECEDCECEVNSDSSCIRTISFTQTVTCKDMEYEFDSARYSLGEDDYIRWSFSPAENVEGVSIYPFGDDNEEHCKSVCVVSDGIYTSEDEDDYVTLGTVYVDMCVNGQCLSGTGFDVTQYTALIEWGTPTSKCTTWTIPGDEGDSIALGDFEFEIPITFICGDERTVINSDMYEEYGVTIEYHLEGNDYAYIDGDRIVVTSSNDTGAPRLVGYLEITVTIGDVSNTYYCDSIYQDVMSELICDYSVPEIEIKERSECSFGTPEIEIVVPGGEVTPEPEPTPEPTPEPSTEYSIPEVHIEYATVPYNGTSQMVEGDRYPIYSYVQYRYENGIIVETITDGGTLLFSSQDDRISVVRADGMMTVSETNTDEMPRELGPVTLNVMLNGQTGVGECYVTQEEADEYKLGYHLTANWSYGGGIAGVVNSTLYRIQPCSYFRYWLIEENNGVRSTQELASGYDVASFMAAGGQITYSVSNVHESITCQVDGQEVLPLANTYGMVDFYTHSGSTYPGEATIRIQEREKLEELYGSNQITLCEVEVYLSIGEIRRVLVDGETLTASWW